MDFGFLLLKKEASRDQASPQWFQIHSTSNLPKKISTLTKEAFYESAYVIKTISELICTGVLTKH